MPKSQQISDVRLVSEINESRGLGITHRLGCVLQRVCHNQRSMKWDVGSIASALLVSLFMSRVPLKLVKQFCCCICGPRITKEHEHASVAEQTSEKRWCYRFPSCIYAFKFTVVPVKDKHLTIGKMLPGCSTYRLVT